jgi:NitT/TauT family transport system substrate-binding protein
MIAVRLGLVLGFLVGLAACRKEPDPPDVEAAHLPPPRITLQMDWYAQAEHGGYYQALVKGYYKEAGLDVTIKELGPGIAGAQMLSGSNGNFGIGRGDETIVQVARDIPVVMVAVQMQHDPLSLLVHRESPVRSFPDLQGHAVMTTPGANWVAYVQHKYHVQFSIIPLNFGMAQFMADPNFIQQCFLTNEPYYVEKNGGHPRIIPLFESGFDPYRGLVGNAYFVAKHPDLTRAFVQASLRGWKDYLDGDPSPAFAEIARRNVQMTPEFLAFSYQAMKQYHLVEGEAAKGEAIGIISRKRLQGQIDALQELGVLDRKVTVDEVADMRFAGAP